MLQDWLAVTWEVSNMIKKRTHIIGCAMLLAVACVGLVACGGGDSSGVSKKIHDRTKWFTEEELSEK